MRGAEREKEDRETQRGGYIDGGGHPGIERKTVRSQRPGDRERARETAVWWARENEG